MSTGATLPAILAAHVHVTETYDPTPEPPEPRAYVDCTADAGVMFAADCSGRCIAATHDEGDELRKLVTLSNPPGMNIDELGRAMLRRYGWCGSIVGGGSRWLSAALAPGQAAVLTGSLAALPAGHWWPAVSRSRAAAHAVWAANVEGSYWLDDPLWGRDAAPMPVDLDDLTAFVDGLRGGAHMYGEISMAFDWSKLDPACSITILAGGTVYGPGIMVDGLIRVGVNLGVSTSGVGKLVAVGHRSGDNKPIGLVDCVVTGTSGPAPIGVRGWIGLDRTRAIDRYAPGWNDALAAARKAITLIADR